MIKGMAEIVRNKVDQSITLSFPDYKYTIIWLHGLGDTSDGFSQFFQAKQSPVYKGAKVKLLQAPIRQVTANGGMAMPSWYDIKSFEFSGTKNSQNPLERFSEKQIKESLKIIDEHVQQEAEYYRKQKKVQDPYKRIIIGGFSQGCAISLLYALTAKNILAGAIGFSGHAFPGFELKNIDKIPILIYHGKLDSVLNYEYAMASYKMAKLTESKSVKIETLQELDHQVDMSELQQASKWLDLIVKC